MAKTEETLRLERSIFKANKKMGVFGCFEVTIGFFGKERVDYMTYDTKGIFRCYEIKTSLSDFHSKAKKTFCGHYNYYVLTKELYEKVIELEEENKLLREQLKAKQAIPYYVPIYPYTNPIYPPPFFDGELF